MLAESAHFRLRRRNQFEPNDAGVFHQLFLISAVFDQVHECGNRTFRCTVGRKTSWAKGKPRYGGIVTFFTLPVGQNVKALRP
ncbi:hypothetical protein P4S70_15525 [Enterovibrio sp. Hal110]